MTKTMNGRPYAVLGQKIRAARLLTGLSQENFAPAVGMTRRHLIRVEGGKNRPGDGLLDRIAERTGVPRASLTNVEDAEEEAQVSRLSIDEILQARAEEYVERAWAARLSRDGVSA